MNEGLRPCFHYARCDTIKFGDDSARLTFIWTFFPRNDHTARHRFSNNNLAMSLLFTVTIGYDKNDRKKIYNSQAKC